MVRALIDRVASNRGGVGQPEFFRYLSQCAVAGPDRESIDPGGGEELNVPPRQAPAEKPVLFDQMQSFAQIDLVAARKFLEVVEDFLAARQPAGREFADDTGCVHTCPACRRA